MLILYACHYKPPPVHFLKFIYSEKATKFFEIFTLLLTTVHTVKSKVKISQNVVAFSEKMNCDIQLATPKPKKLLSLRYSALHSWAWKPSSITLRKHLRTQFLTQPKSCVSELLCAYVCLYVHA